MAGVEMPEKTDLSQVVGILQRQHGAEVRGPLQGFRVSAERIMDVSMLTAGQGGIEGKEDRKKSTWSGCWNSLARNHEDRTWVE